jgi:hypothetical protein
MSPIKYAFALTMLTIMPMTGYSVCTNSWTNGGMDGVWNESANWGGGCVPGAAATTDQDVATFPTTAAGALSVHLDTGAMPVSPGLNQLTFNSATTSYTINTNSMAGLPFDLQFNGATPQLQVLAGSHTISANISLVGPATLTIGVSSPDTLTLEQGLNQTGVTNVTFNGPGQLLNQWNGVNVFSHFEMTLGDFTLTDGIFRNTNIIPITNGNLGTEIVAKDVIIGGADLDFLNTATITDNGVGSTMTLFSGMTQSDGHLNVENSGAITSMMTMGGGVGARVQMVSDWNVTGGIIVNNNSGPIQSTNGGIGSFISTDGSLNLSGSIFNLNNGIVSSNGGIGASIEVGTGVVITNGTVANTNTGTVLNGSIGNLFFTDGDITINMGIFNNTSDGPVTGGGSIGSSISANNIFLNSGSMTNDNSVTATGGGIGSLIKASQQIGVSGGNFRNNDNTYATNLNLNAGGTVTGNGIFKDAAGGSTTLFTNGGVLIPGGPAAGSNPATITIQGTYTQTPLGTLVINLANPASFSQLAVSGPANVGGHLELALAAGATVAPGDSYQIVLGNGVTGAFTDIINFNLGNLTPQLQYFPTFVLLSFLEPSPPPSPPSPLSQATSYANYLEPLFSSVNHTNIRLGRQMRQLRQRFSITNEVASTFINTVSAVPEPTELLADNSPVIAMNPQVEEKQEQLKESVLEHKERPWNLYFGPTGDVGRVLTKKESAGFKYDSIGALAGFDYAFSKAGVGVLLDYDHIEGRGAHQWGKFHIDEAHASLYATYIREAERQLSFNLILGGGYEWYSIRRNIGATSDIAQASPQGAEFDALAGMEYTFERSEFQAMPEHLQVVPLVNLQYIYLHVNEYREHGAGLFNVKYRSQNGRSLRSTLGTRMNYRWKWGNIAFTPEINFAWQREYLDKSRNIGLSAAGLSSRLTMPRSGRNVALAGVDFLVTLFDRYGIEASYDFEWNSLYLDHFFYLGCNFKF